MLPDLYRYLDYRAYLRDWFDARKAANPRFSHRAFARRVGQKSPSILADVISRRRNLTPPLVAAFSQALQLDAEAERFFADLVALDQATLPDDRNAAFLRIAASRRFREAREVEGDSFLYLSSWYIPAIRELARRPDFRAEPAWIAGQLRPEVSPDEAEKALGVLRNLGMLVEEGGRWVQAEGAVVTPREVVGLAVHNYHHGMLSLAREAITRFRPSERHYMALTACVPESLFPQIKQELNAMTERLLELCDGADGTPERAVQLHLHFFPLSATPEETP